MSVPPSGYRPIGANAGFIFASQSISSILRAAYAAVLARKLGPELFGLMNYGFGWYAAFLSIANLQLESYMSRQVALSPGGASDVLSNAMTLRTLSTAIVFALAVAVAVNSGTDRLLATVLLICSVAMVGRSAAMWCASAFISRESAGHVLRIEMAFRVAEVVVGISALLMGFSLIAIVLIHALSWCGQSIYGFWLVRRKLSMVHFQARLGEQLALFRTVLPIAVASIGATWLMQGPFVLFKDRASVPGDLGVVALVLQLFVLATGVPVALGRAALPALSRVAARTSNKDALFLGVVLRVAIPGTTALIIGAAAAGSWLIVLIFGDAYRQAGLNLAYGMMLVLPFGVAMIANQILIAHDRKWQAMIPAVLGATAMTVLVRVLVPAGGSIASYFLCIFVGMSIWLAASLAALSRCVALNWSRCLARPAVVSGLSLGLYHVLDGTIGPCGGLIAALLVLIAGQWLFGIVDQGERAKLSQCIRDGVRRGRRAEPRGQSRK